MMLSKYWRILATGFLFLLFGVSSLLLSLGLMLSLGPLPIKQSTKRHLTRRTIRAAAWLYVWTMRFLGVLKTDFKNVHSLNKPGVLVVANHPTLIDALLLMSVTPNITFIVKAAMAHNFFTGKLVSLAGYIPNNEVGTDLVKKAVAALRGGETIMIFPEGTRTEEQNRLVFKRGAAHIAVQAECPIQPVVIECSPMTLRKHEKWFEVPSTVPLFQLKVLPLIVPENYVNKKVLPSIQARELTEYLQNLFAMELKHSN